MGGSVSKSERRCSEKYVMNLKEKVRLLQEEIKEMMYEREKETRSYERDIMVFTFKEADWKQEGKRLREEVKQLRKVVEEKDEKIREMEVGLMEKNSEKEWELMGTKLLVEQMKEERARRDEAVEKWKQLYLAIKTELDELIQRTYDGDGLYWKAEENDIQMENLRRENQEKEETIKTLKTQLLSMEKEKYKKEREFDLLRQSLRIMNGKKNSIQMKEKLLKSKLGKLNANMVHKD
ncbi:trichohyalin protein [Spatholobus suberectus]|nr:trichohyalin protein [Spatholobus suberectus]